MEPEGNKNIHVLRGESFSLTNPILFSPLLPSEGHIYTTNRNTIQAEDAENIISNLFRFSEGDLELASFCFAQTGVVWGGFGIEPFIQQLHTDHSNYSRSPHHRGPTTWVAVAEREDIQYVVFSGLAKSHESFLTDAKASIVARDRLTLDIDIGSSRISFQNKRATHEKFENIIYSLVDSPKLIPTTRVFETLQQRENEHQVICTNPYYEQPTKLAQDLVGFEDLYEKHKFVNIISNIEHFHGHIPCEVDLIYKIGSLDVCILPGTAHGRTYNIYAKILNLSD